MLRNTWRSVTVLAAGMLLSLTLGVAPEPPAEAQDGLGARAEPVDRLLSDGLTREELMGLYPALAGASFEPPACVAGEEMFDDVPAGNLFCAWIEELARRGITGGCDADNYCPGAPVTRAQMAIFVVKAMEACPTLDPTDEMIRVGGVCIDKYEASIWDAPVGGNLIPVTAIETFCPKNGQPLGNADCQDFYARSVAGVQPAQGVESC